MARTGIKQTLATPIVAAQRHLAQGQVALESGAWRAARGAFEAALAAAESAEALEGLALQLPFLQVSDSMGNHDSEIVDARSVD